ncbi:MAG TPA: hypothetical protein VEJ20_00045 [Candidatus Eremiobacteraceae bacterium]|nr:hypothetical protein [Candidatus Eremiobacteraceae bacterium]
MEETTLPANARMDAVRFDDSSKTLAVSLRGEDVERKIPSEAVAALFGARIRHETTSIAPAGSGGLNFGKTALTFAAGVPIPVKSKPKVKEQTDEELIYALAMRSDGVPELWYLLGASFNFRKALGKDATYSGEMNLRLFVKRLAAFTPRAVQDPFFAAIEMGAPLPPPVETLRDFFKYASAK